MWPYLGPPWTNSCQIWCVRVFHHVLLKYCHENAEMQKRKFDDITLQYSIEGFHVTSQQPNCASHAIHSCHVGSFFALSGIGKSHKICSHSSLLNLHKAKLHRSNNVINIYSLTTSLTCSNKISKKLKHILLFFPGFSQYRTTQKDIQHGVVRTLYTTSG